MSKKQERIKFLVGIRNAINEPEVSVDDNDKGNYTYKQNKIKSVLATIDHLLKEDGITAVSADSKGQ
jgi:hypothetical protein